MLSRIQHQLLHEDQQLLKELLQQLLHQLLLQLLHQLLMQLLQELLQQLLGLPPPNCLTSQLRARDYIIYPTLMCAALSVLSDAS